MSNNVFSSVDVACLQLTILSKSLFSVILLGEVQTHNVHDSYPFLSMVACHKEPAQSQVTGMTDALLGMLDDKALGEGWREP